MPKFGVSQKKEEALLFRMKQLGIKESELDESYTRSSGPGGQHVNKTATCVHLKHDFYARRRLCELLEEASGKADTPESRRIERLRKQKSRRRRRNKSKNSDDMGTVNTRDEDK